MIYYGFVASTGRCAILGMLDRGGPGQPFLHPRSEFCPVVQGDVPHQKRLFVLPSGLIEHQ